MSDDEKSSKQGVRKSFLRLCLGLIITFSIVIVGFLLLILVANLFKISKFQSILNGGEYQGSLTGYLYYAAVGIVQEGAFFVGPLIACCIAFKWNVSRLGFISLKKGKKDLLVGLLSGLIIMTITFLVYNLSGCIESFEQNKLEPSYFLILFFTYVFVAIGEETFSRGLFMATMKDTRKKVFVFLVPSLFFGLLHMANTGFTILSLINLVGLGLVLGYAFYKSGSLWLPIGCHFTWNFFQGVVYGFSVSGNINDSFLNLKITGKVILTGGNFGPEGGIIISIMLVLFFVFLKFYYRSESYDFMKD